MSLSSPTVTRRVKKTAKGPKHVRFPIYDSFEQPEAAFDRNTFIHIIVLRQYAVHVCVVLLGCPGAGYLRRRGLHAESAEVRTIYPPNWSPIQEGSRNAPRAQGNLSPRYPWGKKEPELASLHPGICGYASAVRRDFIFLRYVEGNTPSCILRKLLAWKPTPTNIQYADGQLPMLCVTAVMRCCIVGSMQHMASNASSFHAIYLVWSQTGLQGTLLLCEAVAKGSSARVWL